MMFKFTDNVHGEIYFPNYIQEIISTKEFQRLRNIKQLGVSNHYYQNAVHSRFEHSIGTGYLCGKILEILGRNSQISINENLKKCVVLAGLLHDLGHGPFSHLWENVVREGDHKNWTHEDQSVKMIHHMINQNNIELHSDSQTHSQMIDLICSLITGDCKTWTRLLLPSEMFLTEIVSNKYCKIDVDKFDYILRDFFHVGLELKPFVELLDRAKVVYLHDGQSHIAYHADDFEFVENLFINRSNYHMVVYQHPKVVGIEKQLRDICKLAVAGDFKVKDCLLTEIQESSEKYCLLDDKVLDLISSDTSNNPQIMWAQELIKKLENRNFYELIFETKDSNEMNRILEKLVNKFGDLFCTVEKYIPNASVPNNVPLYDNDGNNVQKTSNQILNYQSTMIFCKAFDPIAVQNAYNFLNNNDI